MRHHRRGGHPRRRARRCGARLDRRAARRGRVPGHPGGVCPAAGLAGRVRDGVPGRGRGDWQLWRGLGPVPGCGRGAGGGGGPLGPAGPAAGGQVGSAGCGQRGAGGPVGQVEAIRALMVAKRSARSERTQTINQARALIITGPDELRARFARHAPADLVAELAALRPRPGSMVRYHTLLSLRELGRRAQFLDGQQARLDELIVPLVTARAPGLLALYGVGPDTAAILLVAAGDHPERLRSEAAWAHLCATAPLSASSGKVTRYRLNPGGDRQANHALYRIVITRLSSHPPTRAYADRRGKEGLSKKEIIRCLKRYVAREVYPHLRPPAR